MFAVDHALTALVIKRRYPTVPLALLLVSVQAMELAWVALNYAGIERTETDAQVTSVANIHLALWLRIPMQLLFISWAWAIR
jgi:hypothetical protein